MKIIKEDIDNLTEAITPDEMYLKILPFVKNHLEYIVNSIPDEISSEFSNYDKSWNDEKANMSKIDALLQSLAEAVSERALLNATENIDEEVMNEGKWKYNLPNGKALRDAINNDEQELVYHELLNAISHLTTLGGEDAYKLDDMKDELSFIDFEADSSDDIEGVINSVLDEFYDYCDDNLIWIPLE